MASLKIEGDLSQIEPRQLEFIKSVIESRGFKDNKVEIQPLGKAGDNYIANVKRITVHDDKGGLFKIVAKIAPVQEMIREMTNIESLFRNEHIIYTKVLPKFTQLEKAADIPPEERFKYAKCYGSLQEAPYEVILLEDLHESNFTILNRFESLGNECIKSVLKNFALLHSLGFVFKNKEPEVYEECKENLYDMWSSMEGLEHTLKYFKHVETGISMLVESDLHKKTVSNSLSGSLSAYSKIAIPDKDSKHSIIQHGDAWTNNLMFKFDGDNLRECIMIDYQISKAGNPAGDIIFLIFNCTDYETRKEYFYDWIDYYHSELDKSLSNYGLKANYIYPRDQLDADLKRYGKLGFGQVVFMTSLLSLKSEEAGAVREAMGSNDPNDLLASTTVATSDPETMALIKKKIEGTIDSFYELGLM